MYHDDDTIIGIMELALLTSIALIFDSSKSISESQVLLIL